MPNFSGVWNLKEQIQAIAAGRWTGLPLYELYAWGTNGSGEHGDNTITNKSSPVQTGSDVNWSKISSGNRFSHGIKTDGTLWAWGNNFNSVGSLGDGTTINRSSPVQIGSLGDWYQTAGGGGHALAVKTNGTLWAWGSGANGRLGNNITYLADRSSPIQIGALTNWSQVAAGAGHSAAVKNDGTLWTWGGNYSGQIGDGTRVSRSSPVQIGALTNWSQVGLGNGSNMTAAIKNDGTLWTWGYNGEGQVGDNTVISRSSPVQVGALTTWAQVSAADAGVVAIKTDGTLWTWGNNSQGGVGDGTTVNKSSPVQIGALTTWAQADGSKNFVAVKTDGTLWTWGFNFAGGLGDGTTVSRSSPVQVGALAGWAQVSAGTYHAHAILQGQSN